MGKIESSREENSRLIVRVYDPGMERSVNERCYVPPLGFTGNPSSPSFTRPDRGLGTI